MYCLPIAVYYQEEINFDSLLIERLREYLSNLKRNYLNNELFEYTYKIFFSVSRTNFLLLKRNAIIRLRKPPIIVPVITIDVLFG